jgi:NAD(P)H-nitrite reductase large subunit
VKRLVVVGNGRAADAFLRQIQRYKCDFTITVFGDGDLLRKPVFYQSRHIDLRQGVRVTAVDRHARLVTGSDGSRTTYDRLILAIGASDLHLPGLLAGHGLVVNRSFETSDGYIYAIGECAEVRDTHWASTLDKQARILASHLSGEAIGMEWAEEKSGRKLFLLPKSEPDETDEVRIA